jgi:hypothetical protein
VGEIATLTPTFTCDAVTKAVRYKVRIYAADSETVLHTSIPLLLPSYPLGGGVLTDYATKKWTFTAYPDTACTAAYGVESAQVSIYKIELDDTLADGTVDVAYTGAVTATGGTGPYTYAVTSGTLPAGLSLSSGGAVTGTPTTAATSAFTVTATDTNGSTGSRAYSVTVATVTCPLGAAATYNITINAGSFLSPVGLGTVSWDTQIISVSKDPDACIWNSAYNAFEFAYSEYPGERHSAVALYLDISGFWGVYSGLYSGCVELGKMSGITDPVGIYTPYGPNLSWSCTPGSVYPGFSVGGLSNLGLTATVAP